MSCFEFRSRVSTSGFKLEFRISIARFGSGFREFYFPDLLVRKILVLLYWPFWKVWSSYTGPSAQFGHDVLGLLAILRLMYWPLGPVWSFCTGPSGQFSPDLLALWASLVVMY